MRGPALMLCIALAAVRGIDVDGDESDLGKGIFESVKNEDASKMTPKILQDKVQAYLKANEHVVHRMMENALSYEIMEANNWKHYSDMVKHEASDVANKVGLLEAFSKKFQQTGGKTAHEYIEEAVRAAFTPIARELAGDPDVGENHKHDQAQ